MEGEARHAVSHQAAPGRDPGKLSIVKLLEKEKQNGKATSNSARPFLRTGEIAILANFTKSTGSFPPFLICLFNLFQMVRRLQLELLRDTLRTVSKPTTQLCSRISKRSVTPHL